MMDWDIILTENFKWIITTLISIGILTVMIISLRKKTPQKVVKVIQKSKEPDSSFGLLIIGGILGFLIGSSLTDGNDEE